MSSSKFESLQNSNFDSNLFGITVYTWGTKEGKKSGLTNYGEVYVHGGDVGHASINMCIPVDEITKAWIEKYSCKESFELFRKRPGKENASYEVYLKEVDKFFPVSKKKIAVRKATFDEKGEAKASSDLAFQREYFDIDFSWWPQSANSIAPATMHTHAEDIEAERHGKHKIYDEKWEEYIQPEIRTHTGKVTKSTKTYAPHYFLHERDLPQIIKESIVKKQRYKLIHEHLQSIDILLDKIDASNKGKLSSTSVLIFKNIGLDLKKINDDYQNYTSSTEYKQFLKSEVLTYKEQLKEEQGEIDKYLARDPLVIVEERAESLSVQLVDVQAHHAWLNKQLEAISTLQNIISQNNVSNISYTIEVQQSLDFLNIRNVALEYGALSLESIQLLLGNLEGSAEKLKQKMEVRHKNDQKLIEEYEALCKKFTGEQLEDELWEFGHTKEDMEEIILNTKRFDVELQEFEAFKKELGQYNKEGVSLTGELEAKLNKYIPGWSSQIKEPCKTISLESLKKHSEDLEKTKDLCKNEKDSTQKKLQDLQKKYKDTISDIEKLKQFGNVYQENEDLYLIYGLPPDHQISLPFAVNNKRGFAPEAMLQEMHKITQEGSKNFDLYRLNCSLSVSRILQIGAAHDTVLYRQTDDRELGIGGTPQQVLAISNSATKVIQKDAKDTLIDKIIFYHHIVDKRLGVAIERLDNSESTFFKKILGFMGLVLWGAIKVALETLKELINFFRGTSEAIIENISFFNRKVVPNDNDLASHNKVTVGLKNAENSIVHLKDDTHTIHSTGSAEMIIKIFESILQDNQDRVVTLSQQATDIVLKAMNSPKDPKSDLAKRYAVCCDESFRRLKKHKIQPTSEVLSSVKTKTDSRQDEMTDPDNSHQKKPM